MNIETLCLHGGYRPENGEPQVLPIFQSTPYKYDTAEHMGELFDLAAPGHTYSRFSNPTVEAVEKKIAALEGGVAAICTSSGQAASFLSLINILGAGDHFITSSTIYGGTFNLFNITMKQFGIDVTFVDQTAPLEELQKAVKPNTKAVFGETLTNPNIDVLDIEKFAALAHNNRVPLIIDNTFPTPILCKPFEFGADIVIHSTTKYMEGHAVSIGGVIVDSGKFNWDNGKFPGLVEPDPSYHGLSFTETFGELAYIVKTRAHLVRDLGVYPAATSAFYLNLGLETLALRMERHSQNAERVAQYLQTKPQVEYVKYPTLAGDANAELAKKYLPKGCSGVVSFSIRGGREAAAKFMNNLKLATIEIHVAEVRTCVMHPASGTHRQMTDEQLAAANITPGSIRLSVGIESVEDILADLEQAFAAI